MVPVPSRLQRLEPAALPVPRSSECAWFGAPTSLLAQGLSLAAHSREKPFPSN